MIRRFHEASEAKVESVTCWGTGSPLREFLHVDDLGEACVFALEHWSPAPGELTYLNVGTGVDISIRDLANAVAAATKYQGVIQWDTTKPDGTPKKQLDVSRLAALGWLARIPLFEGLASTVASYGRAVSEICSPLNGCSFTPSTRTLLFGIWGHLSAAAPIGLAFGVDDGQWRGRAFVTRGSVAIHGCAQRS